MDAISEDSYENLRELYADHNKIDSILPLMESRKFISSFTVLSLRYNKFKTVSNVNYSFVLKNKHFKINYF